MKYISASVAATIDKQLMSSHGFSIDQLMELAGQAVAHCVYKIRPVTEDGSNTVLVLVGPGNNGGDGLVASRHLKLLGYKPIVYCPKRSQGPLFDGLHTQIESMGIEYSSSLETEMSTADIIVDSLFGFSFKPPVRETFVPVMKLLEATTTPVVSVDIPSGWSVDEGPKGSGFQPGTLISLTAPKTCAQFFKGQHFVGGRFVSREFAAEHGFEVPPYKGLDQVYEY